MTVHTFLKKIETRDVVEAMHEADHNYQVEIQPMYMADGRVIQTKKAVVRVDNGQELGVCGNDYMPVQPVAIYKMADELLKAVPGSKINSVLNMHGGSVFGLSLNLSRIEPVSGDIVEMNFLLLASHNGAYGILGRAMSYRFFCLNQMPSSTKLFNLKHTRFVENRLSTAMKMLSYYNQELSAFSQQMKMLAGHRMTVKAQVDWFGSLFPTPAVDSKRSNTMLENNTSTFMQLVEDGRGAQHTGVQGNGWGAINALSEYVNHERSTRIKNGRDAEEVKFESVTFGAGNTLMQSGLSKLITLAKHEPSNKFV